MLLSYSPTVSSLFVFVFVCLFGFFNQTDLWLRMGIHGASNQITFFQVMSKVMHYF